MRSPSHRRAAGPRRRANPWTSVVVLGVSLAAGVGCATVRPSVSKIVNGRVIVTRAISPGAYEHVTRALLYEEEQRWDEAARELQRALPFDDDAAEIRAHLGDLLVRLERLDDAAEQIKRSLETAATVEGHTAAAHLAEAKHDDKRALGEYRAAAALALSDENPDALERAHLALADAELAALDVAAAYETIRTLEEAAPDSVRVHVELAALAWTMNRLPEAETALGEALRLEPAIIDARLMLAALLVATGRVADAKAAFRDTLERAEDPIEIAEMYLKWLVARGDLVEAGTEADRLTPDIVDDGTVETVIRIERAAGRLERVEAAAAQAIKKGARPERIALLVGSAMVDAKDYNGAAARLLTVSADVIKTGHASEFIESRLRAAEALREGGHADQLERAARALAEVATVSAPSSPGPKQHPSEAKGDGGTNPGPSPERDWTVELVVARALLDEKRGDAIKAAHTVDTALEKDPGNPRLLLVRASIDERRGEWRRALTFAEKILDADPRHVEALNFHGFTSIDHDSDLPTATRRLQVAMALNPGAGGIVDSLGWAYLHAGDLKRAAEFLVEADRLEPGDPEILAHLAELFAKRQDLTQAMAAYRRAMERDPTERLAREITSRLRALEAKRAAGR